MTGPTPPAPPAPPTLAEMLQQHIRDCEAKRLSPRTTEFYKENVEKFIWWCAHKAEPPVSRFDEVQPIHFRGFFTYLRVTDSGRFDSNHPRAQRPLNSAGIAAISRGVRAYVSFCRRELDLSYNPMRNVSIPRIENEYEVEVFTNDELVRIFEAINQIKDDFLKQRTRAMTILALDSGMRAAELLSLKYDKKLIEDTAIAVTGKGRKNRHVPLGFYVRNEIFRYMQLRKAVIERTGSRTDMLWIQRDGTVCTYDTVKNTYKRLKDKTGIAHLHMHTFRHTFASTSHRLGISSVLLQRMLGHSSFGVTERYYLNTTADDVRESTRYSVADSLMDLLPQRGPRRVAPLAPVQPRGRPANTNLPDPEQLEKEVAEIGARAVGRKYGVSDTAIRKRLKAYKGGK